jgi:hypothetical protein
MRMIALIASQSLIYDKRSVGSGERFDATPIDAAVLIYRRHAAFAPRGPAAPPPGPPPESVRVVSPPMRRRESVREETEGSPVDKPARRRYRRRDLEPEA